MSFSKDPMGYSSQDVVPEHPMRRVGMHALRRERSDPRYSLAGVLIKTRAAGGSGANRFRCKVPGVIVDSR